MHRHPSPALAFLSRPLAAALLATFVSARALTAPASAAEAPAGGTKPVPVVVAPATRLDLPVEITSFGRVVPVSTVTVQARVTSQVMQVAIADGQRVKQGDLLFVLDAAPFAVAVDKARATLAHDTALAENAAIEERRQRALLEKAAVSKDTYDSAHAANLAAAATRDMSAADLKNAEIQLGYCRIVSPVDGVAGRVEVKAGNLVTENGATLVVINSLAPIRAALFAPESRLTDIRAAEAEAKVFAGPADAGKGVEGKLAYINNQVDPTTGAIEMEAEFPNADLALWPGQYARMTLQLGIEKGVLAVPDTALHPTPDGSFLAAVAKQDGAVEIRTCAVSRNYRNLAIVTKGLEEGDLVVLDGYLRLAKDSRAEIKARQETKVE